MRDKSWGLELSSRAHLRAGQGSGLRCGWRVRESLGLGARRGRPCHSGRVGVKGMAFKHAAHTGRLVDAPRWASCSPA